MPVDLPCAAPFTVLHGFSANQPEQGARFNATSVWLDLGVDHPLAGGQVFLSTWSGSIPAISTLLQSCLAMKLVPALAK
jgi:hypothetical protein